MAEFSENFNELKPSFHFMDMIDPSLEIISHLQELNESTVIDYSSSSLMDIASRTCSPHEPQFSMPFFSSFPSFPPSECSQTAAAAAASSPEQNKKWKAIAMPESSTGVSSTSPTEIQCMEDNGKNKNNSSGGGKRGRSNSKNGEKPKEVVHVRARRGQATDSHSIAERVRREKINERMKCLQGLVPGCYKSMGMAVMLEEIINYVQSLQNQVEFLSMKLTAASTFYDFNLDMDSMATQQALPLVGNSNAQKEMERFVTTEDDGVWFSSGAAASFHSSNPSLF